MSPQTGLRTIALIALTSLFTGCSSISSNGPTLANLLGMQPKNQPSQDTATIGTCQVEIKKHRTKNVEVPLDSESRVQTVLEASGAASAFRKPEVVLFRQTGHPSEPVLKLICQYDSKEDGVSMPTDYAVLPGDRLVVREDPVGPVDEILSSMFGLRPRR